MKWNKADFISSIKKAKEHIKKGDIFQIVLSQQFLKKRPQDPFLFYQYLRQLNPFTLHVLFQK